MEETYVHTLHTLEDTPAPSAAWSPASSLNSHFIKSNFLHPYDFTYSLHFHHLIQLRNLLASCCLCWQTWSVSALASWRICFLEVAKRTLGLGYAFDEPLILRWNQFKIFYSFEGLNAFSMYDVGRLFLYLGSFDQLKSSFLSDLGLITIFFALF